MPWSEKIIARAIAMWLERRCVVLVDNCSWTGDECDVLAVTTDLRIIDIEVKISRSDLKADAKKDKWWDKRWNWPFEGATGGFAQAGPPAPVLPREHPRKVWKHYYAMPKEIWKPELLECLPSTASGVLLLRPGVGHQAPPVVAECVRRSKPAKDAYRLSQQEVMDIARLQNLRMWEAYKRADADREALRRLQQPEAA